MAFGVRAAACGVVAIILHCGHAVAQDYPSSQVRMVAPFPPGGGTDILARLIARKLSESWSRQVVVENRAGANGTIGTAAVAKALPDGHTLLLVPAGFAVNPSIYRDLPFDSARDLAPVSQLASYASLLVVHPSFPPRTVAELVAFLKARPGQLDYASSGNGSPPHLAAELFEMMAGVTMTHVPYKGGGPAMFAVVAGEVPIYFVNPIQATSHLESGRLRPLEVTGTERHPSFPKLPTISEAGVPGYSLTNWYGLLVTGGTPRAVVSRLHAEVIRVLKHPEVSDNLAAQGAFVVGSTPEQFAAFLKVEMEKAARITRAAGMTASN